MKISVGAITFLFLVATPPLSARREPYPGCCVSYAELQIPENTVEDYAINEPPCQPAVEFHLKNGDFACTNPEDQWVQDIVKYIDSLDQTSE